MGKDQNKDNPKDRSVQMRFVVDAVTVLLAFDIGIDQEQASKDKSGNCMITSAV